MDNLTHDLVNFTPFHGLTIWTDGLDEKAPELSTTTSSLPQAQEAGETTPKEEQQKLDPITEEEEKASRARIKEELRSGKI